MNDYLNQLDIQPPEESTDTKEEVKKDFKGLLESAKAFLKELLDIRPNTDQEATKAAIIADIPFRDILLGFWSALYSSPLSASTRTPPRSSSAQC